jgi:hypothetical protein
VSIDILFNWPILKVLKGNFTELIVNYSDPGRISYQDINFNFLKIDSSLIENGIWENNSDLINKITITCGIPFCDEEELAPFDFLDYFIKNIDQTLSNFKSIRFLKLCNFKPMQLQHSHGYVFDYLKVFNKHKVTNLTHFESESFVNLV